MNMEEKIARAICEADGINPEWAGSPDPDCTYDAWENYIPHARSAICALKEPTEGMMDALINEDHIVGYEVLIELAEEGK